MHHLKGTPVSRGIAFGQVATPGEVGARRIVIADDLTPVEVDRIDFGETAGLVLERGGPASHAAIVARMRAIPAVFGVRGIVGAVREGGLVVLDGSNGVVVVNPSDSVLDDFRAGQSRESDIQSQLEASRHDPATTKDGRRMAVMANASNVEDVGRAVASGAEGIGVFRSELFFHAHRALPSEAEQFSVYKEIAEITRPGPAVIRTLDIGGDKYPAYLDLPDEPNPLLGLRGIRLTLRRRELLRPQLSALLRASKYGEIRLLLPMVSSVEEVEEVQAEIASLRHEDPTLASLDDLSTGVMVEVPGIAELMTEVSELVSFFSVGTNDFVQYILAADRTNSDIGAYYDPYHPAVLRALARVVKQGRELGRRVSVCGEMAADPMAMPFFLGIGLDEVSLAPSCVPLIKAVVRSLDSRECEGLAKQMLAAPSRTELASCLDDAASLVKLVAD